jgi:hypothetical protein
MGKAIYSMTNPTGQSEFIIDILDPSGNKLGDGPLITATTLSIKEKLDSIGEIDFEFPSSDPKGELLQPGRRYDVYDKGIFLGRFIHADEKFSGSNRETGTTKIHAYSVLTELANTSVKFRRAYDDEPVKDIVDDLVSLVGGWSATVDSGLGDESITYEGESVLVAIEMLRERLGLHYRIDNSTPGSKVLEFGAFGDDSGVRAEKLQGQVGSEFESTSGVEIIDRLSLTEDAQEIFNRVIPVGSGQGVSQLTIENATSGSYTVQSGLNQDGSSYYYIEDATSVAQYGVIERVLNLSNIRPISNNDTDILNAKNALKIAGETFLTRSLEPRLSYNVPLITLGESVQVGDTIRVVYRGVVDGYKFVDVDTDLNILGIRRRRTARSGASPVSITVSTGDVRPASDHALMINVVKDLTDVKIHVDPTLSYYTVGPYTRRIDSSNTATFTVRIKDEVYLMNNSVLRFRSDALKSSVTAAAAGGDHRHKMFAPSDTGFATENDFVCAANSAGTSFLNGTLKFGDFDLWTNDASGDHTHTMTYGIFADTVYPAGINVSINGIDRTVALGGPWGTTGATTGDIEVDITTYLVNASGGLRQNHTIEFSCTSGRGEIEAEVASLLTIQAIAV